MFDLHLPHRFRLFVYDHYTTLNVIMYLTQITQELTVLHFQLAIRLKRKNISTFITKQKNKRQSHVKMENKLYFRIR